MWNHATVLVLRKRRRASREIRAEDLLHLDAQRETDATLFAAHVEQAPEVRIVLRVDVQRVLAGCPLPCAISLPY